MTRTSLQRRFSWDPLPSRTVIVQISVHHLNYLVQLFFATKVRLFHNLHQRSAAELAKECSRLVLFTLVVVFSTVLFTITCY